MRWFPKGVTKTKTLENEDLRPKVLVKRTRKQSQVATSSVNLNRDSPWVAKRTREFLRKYTKVAKKKHFKAGISCISLADNTLMDVTQLALTWVGWPNDKKQNINRCLLRNTTQNQVTSRGTREKILNSRKRSRTSDFCSPLRHSPTAGAKPCT